MVRSCDCMPFLAMALVQVFYSWMNITSKLALESGMNPLVFVTYRQIFASLAVVPFAYLAERKRPPITKFILFQILLCSLTGATANQVFFYLGLKYSTPTIACAITNILPAVTFVFAVLSRQESVGIKTKAGVGKVIGTIVCVGGAMLLSFYHGPPLKLGQSKIHWTYAENMMRDRRSMNEGHHILGSLLLMTGSVGWAAWFVIQARLNEIFPAPYTSMTLMFSMATIECGLIAVGVNHQISAWSLKSPIRLVGVLYAGMVCSGICYCLTSWSIQKKGPLYVSVFNPLLLVIVAILSWALLREQLYTGTVMGSIMIIAGLYTVLWGKNKEMMMKKVVDDNGDVEFQGYVPPRDIIQGTNEREKSHVNNGGVDDVHV